MRLGDALTGTTDTHPDAWARSIIDAGYNAAVAPKCLLAEDASPEHIKAFRDAAREHDIVIAEVGAWSNPISPDPDTRKNAIRLCQQRLALADALGAACCVNIAGSRHPERWEGPHADNYSPETFDLIVATTQEIIDAINPTETVIAVETMPYVPPDSPESARRLIDAVDRPGQFSIHFDPVNLLNTPKLALSSEPFISRCFDLLGDAIVAVHAKDIRLGPDFPVHLQECAPGAGILDYATLFRCIEATTPAPPVIIEHLPDLASYYAAAEHLRNISRLCKASSDVAPQ